MVYWVFGYGSLIWKPPPHAVEQRCGYVKGVVRRFAQSSLDHRGTPDRPGRVVTVIEAGDWHRLEREFEARGRGGEGGRCGQANGDSNGNGNGDRNGERVKEDGAAQIGKDGAVAAGDIVWGVVYRIEEDKVDEVRAYLEHREKNGYTAHEVPVYTIDPATGEEKVVVDSSVIWIGRLDNPAFVGVEPLDYLSRRIYECRGPSGPNREYVYKLAESVRALYPTVKDDYLFELEALVKQHDPDCD